MTFLGESAGDQLGLPPDPAMAGRPLPPGATPSSTSLKRRSWFVNATAVAVLVLVWQLLVVSNDRIPGLDEVLAFLRVELSGAAHGGMTNGEFWPPLWVSVRRYLAGLAIGVPLGFALGMLIGASAQLRALLTDSVLVLLVLPSVVWAFAASLWFGFGDAAPIGAVVLTAIPFMAFNLRAGIGAIDPGLGEMSRSFRVPRSRRLAHMLLGGALPSVVTGARLAFMTSWNSLLIVEWFGSTAGVGWRARFWYDALRYDGFVAWILLFVVFIVLLDWLFLRRWERRAVRWQQQPTLTFAEDEIT